MLDPLNQVSQLAWTSGSCPAPTQDQRSADADKFVLSFGLVETVELTNLDDPGLFMPNCAVLNGALEDAYLLLSAAISEASECGGEQITANFKRWQVIVARHYLDVIRRRPEVRQDFEDVLKSIELSKLAVCRGPAGLLGPTRGARTILFRANPRVWDINYTQREQYYGRNDS